MSFTSSSTYIPHRWFTGAHLMTLAPAIWQRKHLVGFAQRAQRRLFSVDADSQILTQCHWQKQSPEEKSTLIIVHGLEGSAESNYVRGLAYKAYSSGMNAIRLNLRNCGGTISLTPTLYNAGLSEDVIAVVRELEKEGFKNLFLCGYSLGGNIVLKAAGELGKEGKQLLAGVIAVSPSLDLEICVQAIGNPENAFYEKWFLRTLKKKIRDKARLFPEAYDTSLLRNIRTIREFDDTYTAPAAGYGTASNYYRQASALRVIDTVSVPTMIIASEDDPLVPFTSFASPVFQNPHVTLQSTLYGGHAGFIQNQTEEDPLFDLFWAENRAISFCQAVISQTL